ncbi:MAG TPA: LON peptidase substrate-binding domain-containing protein, partial [Labilithrix sp.]|nr:LON peptidase substrate-binding domain-containing protein [Labilithrix sp.]
MTQLRDGVPLPASDIAALPLRTGVLFPGATLTFAVGRARSVALVRTLYPGDIVVTLTQKDPRPVDLDHNDVYAFGTYARVKSVTRKSDREYELSLEGLGRARFDGWSASEPYYKASVGHLAESGHDTLEAMELARALTREVLELVREAGGALGQLDEKDASDPGALADRIASLLDLPTEQEIELLG